MTDYAIEIAGDPLDTIWTGLTGRFTKFTSATRRGGNLVVPYKHGEVHVPDKYFDAADVLLELFIPGDAEDDGAGALSELALRFSSQSLVPVQQTDPHRGTIEALVEQITDPIPTQNRFVYMYGLALPSGFWRDVAATTPAAGNPPSVTTSGDRPVDDMTLEFAGVGFIEHTDPLGQVARVEIEATPPGSAPYTVDVGAGTVVNAGGTAIDEFLATTQDYWMKWQPGAAQSFTSNVNVTPSWRNKWS